MHFYPNNINLYSNAVKRIKHLAECLKKRRYIIAIQDVFSQSQSVLYRIVCSKIIKLCIILICWQNTPYKERVIIHFRRSPFQLAKHQQKCWYGWKKASYFISMLIVLVAKEVKASCLTVCFILRYVYTYHSLTLGEITQAFPPLVYGRIYIFFCKKLPFSCESKNYF